MSQILAGFTPGEADTLRKAIGKKKKDLMEQMREKFIKGAVERGYPEDKIRKLWEDIEKFASYSFNKSHSVAYGYISYWTAYMKAHHPEEFFAVKLTTEKNDAKFINLIKDAKVMGFEILPPDINESEVGFKIEGPKKIRFGIGKIKGVGEETAQAIVSARKKGKFRGLQDFISRVNGRKVNRKVLEALIKAGAFDFTGIPREKLIEKISSGRDVSSIGQSSLFGEESSPSEKPDILRMEKEVMGFYISGHPLDRFEPLLKGNYTPLEEIEDLEKGQEIAVAGVVSDLQVKKTRNGTYMALFNLIDRTSLVETVVFPDVYEVCGEKLKEDAVVVIKGFVEEDIETEKVKLLAKEVLLPEEFSGNGYVTLLLTKEDVLNGKGEALKDLLLSLKDEEGLQVLLQVVGPDFTAVLKPSPEFKVKISPEFMRGVEDLGLKIHL